MTKFILCNFIIVKYNQYLSSNFYLTLVARTEKKFANTREKSSRFFSDINRSVFFFFSAELVAPFIFPLFLSTLERKKRKMHEVQEVQLERTNPLFLFFSSRVTSPVVRSFSRRECIHTKIAASRISPEIWQADVHKDTCGTRIRAEIRNLR